MKGGTSPPGGIRGNAVVPGVVVFLALVAGVLVEPGALEAQPAIHGYVEPSLGVRYSDDGPIDERNALEEVRALLENQWYGGGGAMLDLRLLAVQPSRGNANVELREGSVFLPLTTTLELTAGRQVLSWGPAQFEFVNDHFAKDFESFFLGRDLEFLKAPNDAVKLSWYPEKVNVDLVVMPSFDPDRLPDGTVIPVLDPATSTLVNASGAPPNRQPESSIDQGEFNLRLSRTFGSWETALYGYRGFSGRPTGFDGTNTFYPELASLGGSVRGQTWGTVVWAETAFNDIRHPEAGETTAVPPDRFRLLGGLRYRYSPTLRYMLQLNWDRQIDASGYRAALSGDHPGKDASRWRVQLAATGTYWEDRLELEARGFWGLTEEDWHLRLSGDYEWSDAISLHVGTLFYGADRPVSRFGALDDHDLMYSRLRYAF